jgi:fermentation-respiration switch protein FrsA (DUF1100 family)
VLRVLVWIPSGVLGAGAVYNTALALGAGSASIRRFHEAPGSGAVYAAAFGATVLAFGIALFCVVRPRREVALYAPVFAAFMVTFDLTYDSYFAPSLDRYWDHGGSMGAPAAAGVALALAVGAVTWWRPREGALATAIALPIVFVATVAYIGH